MWNVTAGYGTAAKDALIRDKNRDKVLSRKGWFIVRFNSPHIEKPSECIEQIRYLIKQSGGLTARSNVKRWIQTETQSGYHQLDLF